MSTGPIPDGLDETAAVCVPVAFGTAEERLFTAGNLEAGQTALIHARAEGVGKPRSSWPNGPARP
jgi:NADPH:quinone reductase